MLRAQSAASSGSSLGEQCMLLSSNTEVTSLVHEVTSS